MECFSLDTTRTARFAGPLITRGSMLRSFSSRLLAPLLLLALMLPFRSAAAHPRLVRAVPAAESHVKTMPHELSVTFSENLTIALSRITLLDAAGRPVALDSLRAAPKDGKTLTVKILGSMPAGRYTVKWQAAGADGHPVRGEYTFVVDAGPVELTAGTTGVPAMSSGTTSVFPGAWRPRGPRAQ